MSRRADFANLRLLPSGDPHRLVLQARGLNAEISSVRPGVARLRLARGRKLAVGRSWAVATESFAPERITVRRRTGQWLLRAPTWSLALRLATGAWEFRRSDGSPCFSAPARATAFNDGKPALALSLRPDESLFGLGETSGTFNKRGLVREFWNTDVLGHAPCIHAGLRSLYVSIPFAISLRGGQAAGLFWDNPARQTWDLGQTRRECWRMTADSGELDLYLFAGPTAADVVGRFTALTGRMPLPPLWGLGYHQCRYSYETRRRVEQVAREFRRRRLPCDAIYFDLHHLDGKRVFTFGKSYPRPAQLIRKLARQGFKVVTIVDPGVKDDPGFDVFQRGRHRHAFVKQADGKHDYIGQVWPGDSRFPDFLNERARRWWGEEQAALIRLGVAGFWNDMNEPANFALPTKTLPLDCRHDSDHGPLTHAEAHNLYGSQMARASRDGALAHRPGERPFIITRAGYAGVQRQALVWTGDNTSCWEHLADSLQMLLNLGVSGVPFVGSDAGGFMDNCTPELLVRWTQMAAFTPFFRNHSDVGTIDQEPWALGRETEAICRRYLELRYRLLPFLYGLFVEAHRSGTPIMRPLFWHCAEDPVAVATGDQFLLGADLLVAPILRQGAAARSVYLPRGDWFDFWSRGHWRGGRHVVAPAPLDRLPLFVRAGAILPMGPALQYVGEKPSETIELHCWPGAVGKRVWYEDDGHSLRHEAGQFCEREIRANWSGTGGLLSFGPVQGDFASEVKRWRVVVHETTRGFRATVNGRPASGTFSPRNGVFTCELSNAPVRMELSLARRA